MAGCHGSWVKFPWPLSSSRYIKAQKGTSVLCIPLSNMKIHKYTNEFAFPERLRDRVAGAFVRLCNNVVSSKDLPPPSSGEKTLLGSPVFLLAYLIKLSFPIHWKGLNRQKKSFKSGCRFFPRRLPHPHWVTTGQAGFSDMGPALSLISHKTAKNRIPAVRTIIFDKLVWKLSGFSQEFIESAVVFSSSS